MGAALELRFEAIGTAWSVEVYEPVSRAPMSAKIKHAIAARVEQFDLAYSRFRPDSLITRLSHQAGRYELPADAQPLFDIYQDLYRITNGAVTPLIGQTLSDAGYDAAYSLTPKPLTSPPAWDETLTYDFPHLTLHQPALLDLGAAGKGYLVDLVSELLEDHGLTSYCVDAGGDMRYRRLDGPPLRVGLEHPADPTQVIGVAELSNTSLCASAGNRRAWGDYHHILNPHTLTSPRHLQAVWVTAPTALIADALATALFFVDQSVLDGYYKFESALVHSGGSLQQSPGFPATFFSAT